MSKPKTKNKRITLTQVLDLVKLAGFLGGLVTGLTSENPRVSWFSLLTALAFASWLAWRALPKPKYRMMSLGVIMVAAFFLLRPRIMSDMMGIKFAPAKPGESLLIISEFNPRGSKRYDVQLRIFDRLKASLQTTRMQNVIVKKIGMIESGEEATRVGEIHNTTFVIWGWYDDAGFNAHFVVTARPSLALLPVELDPVPTELTDFNLYIRDGLPAQMTFFAAFTLGQLYYWTNRPDDAMKSFDIAVGSIQEATKVAGGSVAKNLSVLHFFRANIFFVSRGQIDSAIVSYSKTIQLDSLQYMAFNNRGLAYSLNRAFQLAISDLSARIRLGPASPQAHYNRGLAYFEIDSLKDAIQDWRTAIQLDTNYVMAYNNLSTAYGMNNQPDSAIWCASKTLQKDPNHVGAYFTLFAAYMLKFNVGKGQTDLIAAVDNLVTYIHLEPNQSAKKGAMGFLDSLKTVYGIRITVRPM